MLDKLSQTLKKFANGWLVMIFMAADVLFTAVILPAQEAKMRSASGGTGPIDLKLFYTPDQVYSMVASYGEAGRADYRLFELTGDIIYPIVYTLFFSLLITWLFQRGFAPTSKMQSWNVMPFGAWLFDLLENLGVVGMLSMYPSTPPLLAWLSTIATLIKWLFAIGSILLMLVGLVMAAKNGFKKQD